MFNIGESGSALVAILSPVIAIAPIVLIVVLWRREATLRRRVERLEAAARERDFGG
jgi:hypothetical protein